MKYKVNEKSDVNEPITTLINQTSLKNKDSPHKSNSFAVGKALNEERDIYKLETIKEKGVTERPPAKQMEIDL